MGQKDFGKRGIGLGTEQHPFSIGRKAVPGVEKLTVAAHPSSLASGCRYDEKLAIRLEHYACPAAGKDNPLAVRRESREIIAHAVMTCTFQGLWCPAFSLIERNPVKIKLDGKLFVQLLNGGILDMGADVCDVFMVVVFGI